MLLHLLSNQGNGHENDFIGDGRVYIMDMYNRWIYPNDRQAKGLPLLISNNRRPTFMIENKLHDYKICACNQHQAVAKVYNIASTLEIENSIKNFE